MKKLSTMLALGLSLALTFGMTAFAAESPSTGAVGIKPGASATNAAGEVVSVTVEENVSEKAVSAATEDTVKSVLDTDSEVAVVSVFEVKAGGASNVTVTFTFPTLDVDNYDYWVLHFDGTKWEKDSVKVESVTATSITATFSSLSPVAIVSEAKDGDDDDDDDTEAVTTTAAGTPASPKTAETAPVAGVIALAAIAGAVVATKKVRYNN